MAGINPDTMYDWMRKYPDFSERITAVGTYGTVLAEPYCTPSSEAFNIEYAARQEIGFLEADSLGRQYNHPRNPPDVPLTPLGGSPAPMWRSRRRV